MNREDWRYTTVNAQITQLLDDAAQDNNPATAILRALLIAEMFERNERSHQRAQEARADIVHALQWRIQENTNASRTERRAQNERKISY